MTYIPSSYTDSDRTSIAAAYSDLSAVATAIESHDESIASVEDLLSYYIEKSGELPEFMTGSLLDPSDAELNALWSDTSFVAVVQDWRRLNAGDAALASLVKDFKEFLNVGADAGYTQCVFSVIDDAVLEYDTWSAKNGGSVPSGDGSSKFDSVLQTDMASFFLKKVGNPAIAMLFMLLGTTSEYTVGENPNDIEGSFTAVNADGKTVTLNTDEGEIQASYGQKIVFHHKGLVGSIRDFQEDALENFQDLQDHIDEDLIPELADINYDEPDSQGRIEVLKRDMEVSKSVQQMHSECMQLSQQMLDTMLETISSLIEREGRTASQIAGRI
jgi:hypothetical protein